MVSPELRELLRAVEFSQRILRFPLTAATGLTAPLLVGLALSDGVALIGLVLCHLRGDLGSLMALAVVAIVLNATMFPRIDHFLDRASRLVRTY